MIDPGPSPSWRNLRIYRSSLPADATAIRVVAVDDNLATDSFMVFSPPRAPRVQTLQSYVGSRDPVQIDWTSGLAFPCQRPFDHRDGVAEVPKWRIMPGSDLSAAVSAWMDASGGGPLGWIEVTLDSTTVPSYLQDDIGRDWGALIRYTRLRRIGRTGPAGARYRDTERAVEPRTHPVLTRLSPTIATCRRPPDRPTTGPPQRAGSVPRAPHAWWRWWPGSSASSRAR